MKKALAAVSMTRSFLRRDNAPVDQLIDIPAFLKRDANLLPVPSSEGGRNPLNDLSCVHGTNGGFIANRPHIPPE